LFCQLFCASAKQEKKGSDPEGRIRSFSREKWQERRKLWKTQTFGGKIIFLFDTANV